MHILTYKMSAQNTRCVALLLVEITSVSFVVLICNLFHFPQSLESLEKAHELAEGLGNKVSPPNCPYSCCIDHGETAIIY